jgi:hypothetical protein
MRSEEGGDDENQNRTQASGKRTVPVLVQTGAGVAPGVLPKSEIYRARGCGHEMEESDTAGKIIIAKLSAVFYPDCMAKDKPESRINFPAPRQLRKRLNDYAAQHNTHRNVLLVRFMRAIVGSGKNPDDYFKE